MLQDAPYLLERAARDCPDQGSEVKLALLTACAKLFFQRPPECQVALGLALKAALDADDVLVRDRGHLYLR